MSRRIWSPGPLASGAIEPAGLAERETQAIVSVLRREGPLDSRTLRARVEARFWGPGRFGPSRKKEAAARRFGNYELWVLKAAVIRIMRVGGTPRV